MPSTEYVIKIFLLNDILKDEIRQQNYFSKFSTMTVTKNILYYCKKFNLLQKLHNLISSNQLSAEKV